MKVRFVRPISRVAYVGRYLALAALCILIIAAALHRLGRISTPEMFALLVLVGSLSIVALLCAMRGISQLWEHGARGGAASLQTLLLIAAPLGLAAFIAFQFFDKPKLYDISSDIAEVPQWLEAPQHNQMWMPERQLTQPVDRLEQEKAYPELIGHRYEGALDRLYAAVRKVAKSQRMILTDVEGTWDEEIKARSLPEASSTIDVTDIPNPDLEILPDNGPIPFIRPSDAPVTDYFSADGIVHLQASKRTLIWGLPFDVLIRLKEEAETTVVDIRVASKYGEHDLGLGVEIANQFFTALDAEMQGIND